jgi:phospholipase/carboxylesterase
VSSRFGSRPSSGFDASQLGNLASRPGDVQTRLEITPGLHRLGLGRGRDALIHIPRLSAGAPAPLAVMLHGAGGRGEHGVTLFESLAEGAGLVVLAPESRAASWDVLYAGYGPDVSYIDIALDWTFARVNPDPRRIAIGGFSDGASYALSLGLTNGDLFMHIVAFSPGFAAPAAEQGNPRIFVTHGTRDTVLPIERCSRRIVPELIREGYDVEYREFDGPHTVPPALAREAIWWFLADSDAP